MDNKDESVESKSKDDDSEANNAATGTRTTESVLEVALPGSHTGQTETDESTLQQSKNYEHVKGLRAEILPSSVHDQPQVSKSYEKIVGLKAEEVISQTIENVREFVKQLDDSESDLKENFAAQYLVLEPPKRSYMESLTLTPNESEDACEEYKAVVERKQNIEQLRSKFEEGSQASEQRKPVAAESKSVVDKPLDEENQEIAERFKQIMEMFDSFTKNLESLDHLAVKEREKPTSSRRNNYSMQRRKEVFPAVHDSTGYMSLLHNHEKPTERTDTDTIIDIEESSSSSQPASKDKDCATTMSGFQLHQTPEPTQRCVTIACQTSQHENIIFLSPSTSMTTSNTEASAFINDSKSEAYAIDCNTPTSTRAHISGSPSSRPSDILKHFTSEASGRTVIKMPDSPSIIELSAYAGSPPCERTHHTLHISTTASPSTSIMNRQPLCQRLWSAITDFCAAICICLQLSFIVL